MFEQSKTTESFSKIPIRTVAKSWLARLQPSKVSSAPVKWAHPEEFIGTYCCTFGGQMFWEIKDHGRKELVSLEVEVQQLLNTHNENLGEREASNLSFSIFMIGRHETSSCPTLVIISSNKKSRQRVIETIRNSKLLDKYPGVLLGTSSKHPRYPHSGPARYIAFGTEDSLLNPSTSGVSVFIQKPGSKVTSGTSIYIPVDEFVPGSLGRFRRATVGGFLYLIREDRSITTVGMTVGHAFQSVDYASDQPEELEDDVFEFEFDGTTPDNYFGQESRTDQKSIPSSSLSQKLSSHLTLQKLSNTPSLELSTNSPFAFEDSSELTEFGFLHGMSSNLDWAVIEVTVKDLAISNAITAPGVEPKSTFPVLDFSISRNDVEIATCTGSKAASSGIMCGSSTFLKMASSDTFKEVRTAMLNGFLAYGDSGSWIVEKDTGKLCGHLVAGDPTSGLAYIASAKSVFDDIMRQLDCRIELPKAGNIVPKDWNKPTVSMDPSQQTTQPSPSTIGSEKEKEKGKGKSQEENDGLRSALPREWEVKSPTTETSHIEQTKRNVNLPEEKSTKAPSRPSSMNEPSTDTRRGWVPAPSTVSNIPADISRGPRRGRESGRRPPSASARTNEYFVPKDGIDREVITADICRYLGNDALVRPGTYENPQTRQIQQGYFVTAYRYLTTAMIMDLKADSERWEAERRAIASRVQSSSGIRNSDGIVRRPIPPIVEYRASTTYNSRHSFELIEMAPGAQIGYPAAAYAATYDSSAQAYQQQSYAQPPAAYTTQDTSHHFRGPDMAGESRDRVN